MQVTIDDVLAKYGWDSSPAANRHARNVLSALQDSTAKFAGSVAAFCERLGYHDLELLIARFQSRVFHGVRPELLALMEIQQVSRWGALGVLRVWI